MSEENKKTRVRLKICGSQFVITADESEQYIQKIAKIVDERIKYLDDSDPKLSLQMATIVAALNYCDQLEKERVITRELIKKADDCEAIAKDATFRLNRLIIENAQLREEKAGLHKVIADLKAGTYTEEVTTPTNNKNSKNTKNTKLKPSNLNNINNSNLDETVTDEDFS
ncbi:MAG: cell division protein ZapA [Acutalibacteraceae bacterium]|nr:cell division protein ZapA [Acutalibacteraceae bacterium]